MEYFHKTHIIVPSSKNTKEIYFSGFEGSMITASASCLYFCRRKQTRWFRQSDALLATIHRNAFTVWLKTRSCCQSDHSCVQRLIQVCCNHLCAERHTVYLLNPKDEPQWCLQLISHSDRPQGAKLSISLRHENIFYEMRSFMNTIYSAKRCFSLFLTGWKVNTSAQCSTKIRPFFQNYSFDCCKFCH